MPYDLPPVVDGACLLQRSPRTLRDKSVEVVHLPISPQEGAVGLIIHTDVGVSNDVPVAVDASRAAMVMARQGTQIGDLAI